MNSRRRRAGDFTDSLISFHQTNETQSQSTCETYSKDSLDSDSRRNQFCKCSSTKNSKSSFDSIILAGHVATSQYVSSSNSGDTCEKINVLHNNSYIPLKDVLSVSDTTSYLSIGSDLNKCINLFHNKYLNNENDNSEENTISHSTSLETRSNHNVNDNIKKHKTVEIQCNLSDRPRSMSTNSLKNIESNITFSNVHVRRSKSCITFTDSKTDSNYNVKTEFFLAEIGDKTNTHKKMETVVSSLDALMSKSLQNKDKYSPKEKEEEKEKYGSTSSEKSSTEGLNPSELRAFLHSLEDSKPLKETVMLRRLSVHFCEDSPRNFTERLLTIIEESVTNIDSEAALDYPDVSLCKLSQELRKMCKLIEDETAPEWPQSPNTLTFCKKKRSQEFTSDRSRKSPGVIAISNKDPITPISSPNIKSPKKTYRYIPKNLLYNTKSSLHDSTTTFESLEAFCKGLYPDEYKTFHIEKKDQSDSPLKTWNTILHTCENQMASLENSPNIYEKLKEAATSTSNVIHLHDKRETQHLQRGALLSHGNRGKTDSKSTPDMFKQRTKINGGSTYSEITDTDDLKDTLMYEIAKKRQKYLNTAKKMETDANLKSTATQKKCPEIVISEESSSTDYDPQFMEILKSVKDYQDYLDQHRSLFSFLRRGSSCSSLSCEKKDISSRKIITGDSRTTNAVMSLSSNKENIKTLRVPKSPITRKKSTSPSSAKRNKVVVVKPRLFVTPTKPSISSIKSCKTRSSRPYFPNLGVTRDVNKKKRDISPQQKSLYREIGSYDHVISPVGTYIRGTDPHLMKNLRPKTDEMLLTPRKRQLPSPKPKLKFRLSPKQPKQEQTSEKVNIDLISHPKVHYKLPSHVRTIKEAENRKTGNRVNKLLRSAQDKVVIRHEGRTKSVQTDSSEQPEIHYDSAEESVHIEQTARKTYFSRV